MAKLDYLEIFLYIFPIFEIIVIHLFFRSYLQYKNDVKLSITDVIIPMLIVGIHILSVRLLTYSLLPHFILGACMLGFLLTAFSHWKNRFYSARKIFSLFLKFSFVGGFFFYYTLVVFRMIQIFKS